MLLFVIVLNKKFENKFTIRIPFKNENNAKLLRKMLKYKDGKALLKDLIYFLIFLYT